jgi:DNA topoisomerase II
LLFKVLFDAAGCLRKFDSPEQICQEFFDCRKELYKKRKRYLEGMLQAQSDQLSEKARFILMKIQNQLLIENKRKAAIVEQLVKNNFKPDPVKRWKDEQKRKELEEVGEVDLSDDETEVRENAQAQFYIVILYTVSLLFRKPNARSRPPEQGMP